MGVSKEEIFNYYSAQRALKGIENSIFGELKKNDEKFIGSYKEKVHDNLYAVSQIPLQVALSFGLEVPFYVLELDIFRNIWQYYFKSFWSILPNWEFCFLVLLKILKNIKKSFKTASEIGRVICEHCFIFLDFGCFWNSWDWWDDW